MKLFIFSNNDLFCEIDLLDNSAINRWAKHFSTFKNLEAKINLLNLNFEKRKITDLDHKIYDSLLLTIKELKTTGILDILKINPSFSPIYTGSQEQLNSAHNIFIETFIYLKNNFPNFYVEKNSWQHYTAEVAERINRYVHMLELSTFPTDNLKFCKENFSHSYFQTIIDTNKDLWFEFTEEEQMLFHNKIGEKKFYSVVFSNEILGKTPFVSFLDNEKSDSIAISGITSTRGNLEIKLDYERSNIYSSDRFKSWFQNAKTKNLEMPVGNIHLINKNVYQNSKNKIFRFELKL